MKRAARVTAVALCIGALVSGCAAGPAASWQAGGRPGVDPIAAPQLATALSKGGWSRADVRARLGEPVVVHFTSGYEVWVYRYAEDTGAKQGAQSPDRRKAADDARGELVILFAPSGDLAKVRMRMAPAPDG